MRRSTKTDAFTLVEVVVASAVAVLIAAAVAAALISAFGAFSRTAADPETERNLERIDAFETLRADLACAAPLSGTAFAGAEDGFSCARLLSPRRTPDGAVVVRVEWAASPDGGCVRTVTRAGAVLSEERHGPAFGPLRFSYGRLPDRPETPPGSDTPDRGLPARDEPAWSDAWSGTDLPAVVRVRWGSLESEIALPCAFSEPENGEVRP